MGVVGGTGGKGEEGDRGTWRIKTHPVVLLRLLLGKVMSSGRGQQFQKALRQRNANLLVQMQ